MTDSAVKCRTCKWLNVQPRKDGKIVPRKDDTYQCKAPIPAPPTMPMSIKVSVGQGSYYGGSSIQWPTYCGYMCPDDGVGCPFHEPRK